MAIQVRAGLSHFPSPAQDYEKNKVDLNLKLIRHPAATFLFEAVGDSMMGSGIFSGSVLVVDKAVKATNGSIVIAAYNGEWLVKRLQILSNEVRLLSENPAFEPVVLKEGEELQVFGKVIHVITTLG
ncbi:LexA family protein [Methylobacillus sp. Pita2]|uniref:LexA family protein n=1 Tax=Methylobacillus sp. Pita2 TaxID=3383245 RepID=UPI0038B645AE